MFNIPIFLLSVKEGEYLESRYNWYSFQKKITGDLEWMRKRWAKGFNVKRVVSLGCRFYTQLLLVREWWIRVQRRRKKTSSSACNNTDSCRTVHPPWSVTKWRLDWVSLWDIQLLYPFQNEWDINEAHVYVRTMMTLFLQHLCFSNIWRSCIRRAVSVMNSTLLTIHGAQQKTRGFCSWFCGFNFHIWPWVKARDKPPGQKHYHVWQQRVLFSTNTLFHWGEKHTEVFVSNTAVYI